MITQQLFGENAHYRRVAQNATYTVILKSPRAMRSVITFGSQLFPYKSGWVVEAFEQATRLPHSYLLFDMSQNQSPSARLRSHMFKDEFPPRVYIQNSAS